MFEMLNIDISYLFNMNYITTFLICQVFTENFFGRYINSPEKAHIII